MKNFLKDRFNRIFILLWMVFALLIWMLEETNPPPSLIRKIFAISIYLLPLIATTYALCTVILPRTMKQKRMLFFFSCFIAMSIFQSIVLWLLEEGISYIADEWGIPIPEEKYDPWEAILGSLPIMVSLNLSFSGIKFYIDLSKLHEQHLELQKAYLETKLHTLQAQINPHFMFNVLNHIHMLIQKDTDLATTLLLKYSEVLRYQLYSSHMERVSLEREIRFLTDYVDVEMYRWKNTVDVDCKWQIEDGNRELPPLLLIIFVENAFKHVSRSKMKKGFINIRFEQKADIICMEIENSKSSERTRNQNSGLGLDNVRKRLDLLYADNYDLVLTETENIYHVKLILKKQTDGQNNTKTTI